MELRSRVLALEQAQQENESPEEEVIERTWLKIKHITQDVAAQVLGKK